MALQPKSPVVERQESIMDQYKEVEDVEEEIQEKFHDITKKNVGELAEWLGQNLEPSVFVSYKAAFEKHKIDGMTFALIDENHLKEMVPDASIGDRLKMLQLRDKMMKVAQMARRNLVIMQGECKVEPPYGGNTKCKFILTESALKLVYVQVLREKNPNPKDKHLHELTTEFMDNIDITAITDLDFEETLETETKYKTEKKMVEQRHGFCNCSSRMVPEIIRVADGKETKGVAKLYMRLATETGVVGSMSKPHDGADQPQASKVGAGDAAAPPAGEPPALGSLMMTNFLVLTLQEYKVGVKLHGRILDLMHEAV